MNTAAPALLLALALAIHPAGAQKPRVPWRKEAQFVLDADLSDEFSGSTLDTAKWDEHGLRNPDTDCPKWNGPPSESDPTYSVFFPATDNPDAGGAPIRQYRLNRGRLEGRLNPQPLEFFTRREYYCNSTTFTCNHNANIDCFSTNFFGKPIYLDKEKTLYAGITHDKCKISPFCIPHPLYIQGRTDRTYSKYASTHISSKKTLKYGFLEARVRLPPSSAILAIWMHNDEMVNGYCRYKIKESPTDKRLECPSRIRSRRWEEIDLLEAMNSDFHKQKYTPNVHAFSMYKGEFSSAIATDPGDGEMGGGNIIVRNIFHLKNPSFTDIDPALLLDNDFHWNPGSVADLSVPWADQTRTVGVYWSPNEIRFYLDGVEVRRLKNTIIHQPMHLDLSTALNVQWAKELPVDSELKKYNKIFYVRTWKVFTKDGEEPSTSLTFDLSMENRFNPRYGDQMLGVFDRFPYNDDLTDFPSIPDPEETLEEEVIVRQLNESLTTAERAYVDAVDREEELGDYIDTTLDDLTRQVRRRFPGFRQAGGPGNQRYSRGRKKMSPGRRFAALANPGRSASVSYAQNRVSSVATIEDPEITAFEFSNCQKNQAAWASENAEGNAADMA